MTRRVEWVEREKLARLSELGLHCLECDPSFDAHHHVGLRVLDHAVEARRVQEHIGASWRIAHPACPAAADRDDRHLRLGRFVQAPREVFGRRGFLNRRCRHHHFASIASPVRPAR